MVNEYFPGGFIARVSLWCMLRHGNSEFRVYMSSALQGDASLSSKVVVAFCLPADGIGKVRLFTVADNAKQPALFFSR